MSDEKKKSRSKAVGGSPSGEEAPRHREDDASSVQPQHEELAKAIAEEFRYQQPQWIDVFPTNRRGEHMERLKHYDIQLTERIDAKRAGEIANEIWSVCQNHCDAYEKPFSFVVCICDTKRGGLANPVLAYPFRLDRRIFRPAPVGALEDGEEEPTAVKIMLDAVSTHRESTKIIHEHRREETAHEGRVVGDILVITKQSLADREKLIQALFDKNLAMADRFLEMARVIGERNVEAQAVAIEAGNAMEDREDRRAKRQRETMWDRLLEATILSAAEGLKAVFPGIGALIIASLQGKPIPDPPQLGAGNGTSPPQPQLPGTVAGTSAPLPTQAPSTHPAPTEALAKLRRFIDAAENEPYDANNTRAECLFGKTDAAGHFTKAGVFRRDQILLLIGVCRGHLDVSALDALLPDSGKVEAISAEQMVQAVAFLTPGMTKDIGAFLYLRKAARDTATTPAASAAPK